MTTAFWCVMIAGLLPYLGTIIAKFIGGNKLGPGANHNPRDWLDAQQGYKKRANAAQLNGFEGFPLFAAAVIIAQMAGGAQATIDQLAVGYVLLRLLYLLCYVADWASLRTLVWGAGLAACVALFLSPTF